MEDNAQEHTHEERRERLKLLPFIVTSMHGLLNTDSGFFYTIAMLAVKPWKVVRDYIHGDGDRYMAPIAMLLTLLVYSGFFSFYFDGSDGHIFLFSITMEYVAGDAETFGERLHHLWCDIVSSQQIAYLALCPPIVCGVFLAYIRNGSRRFNITEYLVAAIYMLCTILIYDVVGMFFSCLNLDVRYILWIILIVIFFITLTRSFHISRPWLHIPLIMLCMVLIGIFMWIFIIIFTYASGDSIKAFNVTME